jgi:hypothetical protein
LKKIWVILLFWINVSHAEGMFDNPYMDFGVWFGGDLVATNPDGDDYKAGSGAVLALGIENAVINKRYANRTSFGVRYQGAQSGKGENSGLVLESSLLKKFNSVSIGAGLHYDFQNSVSDTYGNKTNFKNSIGEFAYIEWVVNEKVSMSVRYLLMDYESDNGVPYAGDQAGLVVTLKD